MEYEFTKALALLLLPPGGNVLLALLGLLLMIRSRLFGVLLIVLSFASLYALSMPIVADGLSARLETASPDPLKTKVGLKPGAIVVLGGGKNSHAPEYDGPTVSSASLERIRYAARLQRETGLPVLVTGGAAAPGELDEASLMKDALEQDFKVPVKWVEPRARTTAENASYSASMLKKDGIISIYLVTHAAHLNRAVEAFERRGMTVVPAPTAYRKNLEPPRSSLVYMPSAGALFESSGVIYEFLGALWYRWRDG